MKINIQKNNLKIKKKKYNNLKNKDIFKHNYKYKQKD